MPTTYVSRMLGVFLIASFVPWGLARAQNLSWADGVGGGDYDVVDDIRVRQVVLGCMANEPCDDGNPCTTGDTCAGGVCHSGSPLDCDDNNVCTNDSCDPTRPGDPCVHHVPIDGCFTDGNDCTLDRCDPVLGCVFEPLPPGTACNDSLNCTHNDACDGAGSCVGLSPCDDGLPCTDDLADESNGCACSHATSFPGTPCDDGNACTSGTVCDGLGGTVASCNGGSPLDCDDNNVCTNDSCDPTRPGDPCVHHVPSDGCFTDGNDCTLDRCDPVLGCVFEPLPRGTACNDSLNCTHNDACDGWGSCVGLSACDDGLPCNDDFADESNGCACLHATSFPGTPCDDGNACTSGTVCDGLGDTVASCNGGKSFGSGDVSNVHVDKSGGAARIAWNADANASSYDVAKGALSALPVGPGGGDESCLGSSVVGTTASDAMNPAPGAGFFYVIRGKAACGPGPYGSQSNGSPRITTSCP